MGRAKTRYIHSWVMHAWQNRKDRMRQSDDGCLHRNGGLSLLTFLLPANFAFDIVPAQRAQAISPAIRQRNLVFEQRGVWLSPVVASCSKRCREGRSRAWTLLSHS